MIGRRITAGRTRLGAYFGMHFEGRAGKMYWWIEGELEEERSQGWPQSFDPSN